MFHWTTFFRRQAQQLPALAEDESRFVIASNGTFVERRTPMYATSVRINQYELDLEEQPQYCRLFCGRIPAAMHRAMLAFFWQAHTLHGGEAALILLYHPRRRNFRWLCPQQTIELWETKHGWRASDQIEFHNPWVLPDGYLRFGDAHLHPGSPHPSALDVQDDEDGLHIIVGNITRTPQYNLDFVMDRRRFRLRPQDIFQQPDCRRFSRAPGDWLKKISIRTVPLSK